MTKRITACSMQQSQDEGVISIYPIEAGNGPRAQRACPTPLNINYPYTGQMYMCFARLAMGPRAL